MKKLLALLLALGMIMLCACGGKEDVKEEPADQEVNQQQDVDPTPPPVKYRNPLNGAPMDAPYDGRVFAVTIDNISNAMPHHGISQADIFVEAFINHYATRGLALFSNIAEVESIGPIRSTRFNFTDLALAYNLIVCHASASLDVREDMYAEGIDEILADSSVGYRDSDRYDNRGYNWEHTLFLNGQDAVAAAEAEGFALSISDKDYGLQFTEDGTPAAGSSASQVVIDFTHDGIVKNTTMKYDATTGEYVYWQHDQEMLDENNGQPEGFRNVIVMLAYTTNVHVYHVAELYGSGEGYFACGGKMVPILWSHEGETDPIRFTLTDGTPLELGVGSTYLGIVPTGSSVTAS